MKVARGRSAAEASIPGAGSRTGHIPDHRRLGDDEVVCRLCGRAFRTISWSHLVHAHSFDRQHPIESYKRRCGLARAFSEATIRAMQSSLGDHFNRLGRRWTAFRARSAILKRWKESRNVSWKAVFQEDRNLAWAARRCYGSWERAIRSCGLSYGNIRLHHEWTPEELLETLHRWDLQGLTIHYQAVRSRSNAYLQAALLRRGTWERVVRVAGFAPERARIRRRWTSESVKEPILKLGRWLPVRRMRRLDSGLHRAAVEPFGGWRAAFPAAGLPCPGRRPPRLWPRERVLEEIKRRADLGMPLRATDLQRECRGLRAAGDREFGTWTAAVRAAGVPYPKRQGGWKWPRERILRTIRERVGRRLPVSDGVMKTRFGGLWWAGRREFGTWRKAVAAAEVPDRHRQAWLNREAA
jgi:hypothetical protein